MVQLTDFEAVSIAEGFGDGQDATEEQRIEAWQHLIDTGLVWRLQGWFGRMARDLIQDGVCQPAKRSRRRA